MGRKQKRITVSHRMGVQVGENRNGSLRRKNKNHCLVRQEEKRTENKTKTCKRNKKKQ